MDASVQAETANSTSSYFCSIQALDRLDDAHPHRESPSALLNLPIQKLTSSGDTFIDILRNNVFPDNLGIFYPTQVDI